MHAVRLKLMPYNGHVIEILIAVTIDYRGL